jgi:hypothetical protein
MNPKLLKHVVIAAALVSGTPVFAQPMSTPAATEAEKEAFYATTIENRVADIMKALNVTDEAKSKAVHDALVAQYHALRVRDAAIDTQLKVDGKEVSLENRAPLLAAQSKPLHDPFLAKLAESLTADQVEKVKDLMTYNKVKVTYDAYVQIVPALTDADKAKVLELLKAAREEAIDGGSAPEKTAIFQKYKDQINTYLNANGHDTVKAFKDWTDAHPNTNNPAVNTATAK